MESRPYFSGSNVAYAVAGSIVTASQHPTKWDAKQA